MRIREFFRGNMSTELYKFASTVRASRSQFSSQFLYLSAEFLGADSAFDRRRGGLCAHAFFGNERGLHDDAFHFVHSDGAVAFLESLFLRVDENFARGIDSAGEPAFYERDFDVRKPFERGETQRGVNLRVQFVHVLAAGSARARERKLNVFFD